MAFQTPVLFLVFNRPDLTKRVFERVREIKPQYLYVAADGPRPKILEDNEKCNAVRRLILDGIDWDCEVKTLFRDKNLGCGKAVSEAITWFFDHVEEGIILEDDCLPDLTFFNFCRNLLLKYKEESQVMHIGGHSLGVGSQNKATGDFYFSAYNHIWGWATWRRAWNFYRYELSDIDLFSLNKNLPFYFETKNEITFWLKMFYESKKIDTWDYNWTFSIWLNRGISILPRKNIVKNIGFGVESTHTNSESYLIQKSNYEPLLNGLYNTLDVCKLNHGADLEMSNNIFNINAALSPLTLSDDTKYIKSIPVNLIIDLYSNSLNLDVSVYFSNVTHIKIFECNLSGYRFYYPYSISGEAPFYEHLQQYSWYYMPWKWEHSQALRFIKPGMSILEVGCGPGDFLNSIKKKNFNISIQGLELNKSVIERAYSKGVSISTESVEQHADANLESYDLVCSFQVLEHIYAVNSFIKSQIICLKKGGVLIISVPNNDSFIKYSSQTNLLNMPPHHMGLWTSNSLKKLEKIFPIRFIKIKKEPLQPYHFNWFLDNLENRVKSKGGLISFFYFRLKCRRIIKIIISIFPHIIDGHTIMAIFEKK